jgi:hypothetical protein
MSRRAASMAAMAKRAKNPQEIQAIQKSLVDGVQNGSIQPYVGIPLIQELTQKLTEAKAQMAQSMAGAGMPQGQQGAPIAQQVMQQAAQESQGLEALPSNLPQEYAGGGIIAFEEGGPVERYQDQGLVPATPAGRFFSGLGQNFSEANEAAKLRNKLQMQYGPKSALPGLFMAQSDAERQMAKDVVKRLDTLTLPQLQALYEQGPSALPPVTAPVVTPTATPAAALPPAPADKAPAPAPAAPAAPAIPGAGKFVPPTLEAYTPTIATLPERKMEPLTDLGAITKDMDTKTKTAAETAVTKTQKIYEDMDKPGNEAREAKFGKREAEQEKNSAMGRALNLMNLGFGIAGSKERTVAGALANEGRQGIRDLIQGEAASRAAKERLDDARDNFEQQKVQAKKGNYQAAQTAGREAANDLRAATTLSLQGAQAGNAQSISMYNALSQSDIGRVTVGNQGEQIRAAAIDSANRNKLGVAGLEFQNRQLNQQAASTNAQLQLGRERLGIIKDQIAAGNKKAEATLAQAEIKAASAWQSSPQFQQVQAQAKKMPPTEAQRFMQQSWLQYRENMLPSLMGGSDSSIPSFSDLYKATE